MAKPKRVIDVDVYEEEEREPRRRARVPEGDPRRKPRKNIERKIDRDEESEVKSDKASENSNQGNLDFGQLAGMLENVDMNQISALLGGLGGNNGGGQGLLGSIAQMIGSGGGNNLFGNLAGMMGGAPVPQEPPMYNTAYAGDKRLQILNALKPMVSPERAALIDMVLQIYTISKILRG